MAVPNAQIAGPANANGANNHYPPVAQFTLDECRIAALAEIDNANFSWFHLKVCLVAGVGFFTDAYDIFAIGIASTMIGHVWGQDGHLSPNQALGLKAAAPVGTFFGQILFGWLADRVGRKRMYGIELMIMIVSTFAQAVSGSMKVLNVVNVLVVWRFIMGIGVGGDYPLSAVIVSEFSPIRYRGRMMTSIVASQGWGNFAASLVALVAVSGFSSEESPDLASVDYMWRVLIGLGCVPAVLGLYGRLTVSETPRFTIDVARNLDQALADIGTSLNRAGVDHDPEVIRRISLRRASWNDFTLYFSRWENLQVLVGAAYSWFAIDFSFYGLGLNSPTFLQTVLFDTNTGDNSNIYQILHNVSACNLAVAGVALIPGYYVTFGFIDTWGRKYIQLTGFIALAVLFLVMGFAYNTLTHTDAGKKATVFLYCLAGFFQNFGPNTTTFIIPGEIFPTRYRSTCHGISAASGKLGAIASLVLFSRLENYGGNDKFFNHILQIFVFFMLTGIGSTMLLPETKGLSLEELSNERQQGFVPGYAHREHPLAQLPPLTFFPFTAMVNNAI